MKTVFAAFILSLTPTLWSQSYTINTYAGVGLLPLPGPALSTSMGTIEAVAADGVGNFYVADSFANLVFKISAAGFATVVAGNGSAGYSGDGGPATSAQLNNPKGLAVDAQGNLFISDSTNRRIRKVSGAGVITTIAGNGTPGYSGDGGPAAHAQIDSPAGLAFDAIGDLFITDIDNSVIRKVSTAGTISTFAGNGTVGYSGDGGLATEATFREPYGVAVDVGGNVYIADTFNSVIRKVTPGGIISTFAGNGTYGFSGDGGPALGAEITYPFGISVDAVSNLYIADSSSARVRKVTPTGIITTVAGDGDYGYAGDGGAANSAELEHPTVLAIGTNGTLFIGDVGNDNVRQVSSSQIITTAAGNGSLNYAGDNGPAARALLAIPSGLALLGDGSIVASDSGNNRVREISASGVITTIAGNGYAGYTGDNSLATQAEFDFPVGVAADASGNIYVADVNNAVVRKIGVNGVITTFAGTGQSGSAAGDGGQAVFATLSGPVGVAVDNTGAVYIADTGNCDIRKVSLSGVITTVAGDSNCGYFGDNGSAVLAELNEPQSLAFDAAGDLYIADAANYVIRKVDTNGIITTVAGNGTFGDSGDYGPATSAQLGYVDGIAIDEAGNLYISNEGFPSLRKVAASGIITTIAGGVPGYSGDRGPAIGAALSNAASQIALGPNGTIYFADTDNNAIRTLTVCIQSLASTAGADATAQTLSIPLSATSACSWSASNLPSWITAASSGTGSGTLALTLQANTTGGDRSATISVNGLNIAVTQDFTVEQFKDVVPSVYYFDAVNLLKAKNITSGCGPTDYCPTENVTRAQMAVFIVRAIIGSDTFTYSQTPHFTDVQPTDFGFAWIQKLDELGITAGCAPNLYCPNDSITRAQMAVFIIRARYGAQTVFDYPQAPYFTDVPGTGFAFNYIQRMKEDNITAGCSAIAYCPNNPVTRGDMAIFIMRGTFNTLLPPTEPVIISVSPTTITNGTTATLTVIGGQTNFVAGSTSVNAVPGLTINSITVTNATTLQVSVTSNTTTAPQPLSIWVTDPTEEAVLPNGLTAR